MGLFYHPFFTPTAPTLHWELVPFCSGEGEGVNTYLLYLLDLTLSADNFLSQLLPLTLSDAKIGSESGFLFFSPAFHHYASLIAVPFTLSSATFTFGLPNYRGITCIFRVWDYPKGKDEDGQFNPFGIGGQG